MLNQIPDAELTNILQLSPCPTCKRLATALVATQTALIDRKAIEQAKGLIGLNVGCSEPEAFKKLQHLASATNKKLADAARDVIERAKGLVA